MKRTKEQILKLTAPLNAKYNALRDRKRDRMYALLKKDQDEPGAYDREWPAEKARLDAEMEDLDNKITSLDHEYHRAGLRGLARLLHIPRRGEKFAYALFTKLHHGTNARCAGSLKDAQAVAAWRKKVDGYDCTAVGRGATCDLAKKDAVRNIRACRGLDGKPSPPRKRLKRPKRSKCPKCPKCPKRGKRR